MEYIKNPKLKTIIGDWKGNPVKGKEFQYVDTPLEPSINKMLKWATTPNPQRREKRKDKFRLPILNDRSILTKTEGDFVVWLGHASFLIQTQGIRILTDPVLSNVALMPRLAKLPFGISEIQDIDYILLSHDHRDHCDEKSIKRLVKTNAPTFLTPLRLTQVIKSWVGGNPIMEAGWYQVFHLPEKNIEITFLPTRHWCKRGLLDYNHNLWGAYLIQTPDQTIYFGGDSSYAAHYTETNALFPNIDLAMLGIGAYKPEYMMKDVHTSPQEAAKAFFDLGAKRLLPMHYGTYDLSEEPISEPERIIKQEFANVNRQDDLSLLGIGKRLSI